MEISELNPESTSGSARPGELTRAAILNAAVTLADTEGLEAITMRRIAGVLGVSSMAAYRHIRTKEEIFRGLGAMAWEALEADLDLAEPLLEITPEPVKDWVRARGTFGRAQRSGYPWPPIGRCKRPVRSWC